MSGTIASSYVVRITMENPQDFVEHYPLRLSNMTTNESLQLECFPSHSANFGTIEIKRFPIDSELWITSNKELRNYGRMTDVTWNI